MRFDEFNKQSLVEARIYGNLQVADKVRISVSEDGSTVIAVPEDQARFGTLLEFDANETAIAAANEILQKVPRNERGDLEETVAKAMIYEQWPFFVKNMVPKYDEDSFKSKELVEYLRNELANASLRKATNAIYINGRYGFEKKPVAISQFKVYVAFYGLQYLVLDNSENSITVVNTDKKDHVRMGALSGNTQYILIDSNYSMNQNNLRKILASLIKVDPNLKDFRLNDSRLQNPKTVIEFIKGFKNQVPDLVSKTTSEVFAYHGTSRSTLNKILKDGAMLPGQGKDYSDKIKGHSENLLYFSLDIEETRKYAVRAARTTDSIILRAKITDMTRLRFDEDSLFWVMQALFKSEKKLKQLEKLFYAAYPDYKYSFSDSSVVNWLNNDGKTIFSSEANKAETQLLAFINANALKINNITSGHSFGYQGRLPLSSLSLVETFTSVKHDDEKNYDGYDAAYDAVKDTQTKSDIPLTSLVKTKRKAKQ